MKNFWSKESIEQFRTKYQLDTEDVFYSPADITPNQAILDMVQTITNMNQDQSDFSFNVDDQAWLSNNFDFGWLSSDPDNIVSMPSSAFADYGTISPEDVLVFADLSDRKTFFIDIDLTTAGRHLDNVVQSLCEMIDREILEELIQEFSQASVAPTVEYPEMSDSLTSLTVNNFTKDIE